MTLEGEGNGFLVKSWKSGQKNVARRIARHHSNCTSSHLFVYSDLLFFQLTLSGKAGRLCLSCWVPRRWEFVRCTL